jgi:hypothetical protein
MNKREKATLLTTCSSMTTKPISGPRSVLEDMHLSLGSSQGSPIMLLTRKYL